MAKHVFVLSLALCVVVSGYGQSCCNAGGLSSCGSTGLLTGLRNNSVGLRLMAVPFETATASEKHYRDNFYVAEFSGRYEVAPRLKIGLQQPYRWNHRKKPGKDEWLDGFADTRVTASYACFDNKMMAGNSLFYWEIGAGLKLPTGKYDASIYYRDLPGNLQLGMGNLGYLFQSGLVFFHKKMGVAHQANFQLNGKSRDNYQFGNQFTSALTLFREVALKDDTKLTPMLGATVEWFGKNYLPSGKVAEGAGGHGILLMVGINARFDTFQVGANSSTPFQQNYSQGAIVAKQRFSLELTYFL